MYAAFAAALRGVLPPAVSLGLPTGGRAALAAKGPIPVPVPRVYRQRMHSCIFPDIRFRPGKYRVDLDDLIVTLYFFIIHPRASFGIAETGYPCIVTRNGLLRGFDL